MSCLSMLSAWSLRAIQRSLRLCSHQCEGESVPICSRFRAILVRPASWPLSAWDADLALPASSQAALSASCWLSCSSRMSSRLSKAACSILTAVAEEVCTHRYPNQCTGVACTPCSGHSALFIKEETQPSAPTKPPDRI